MESRDGPKGIVVCNLRDPWTGDSVLFVTSRFPEEWTDPLMSIIIIYNRTWSILIQQIRIILSGDILPRKHKKKDPFTSLHKIKANLPHRAVFEILRNGAFSSSTGMCGQLQTPEHRLSFLHSMLLSNKNQNLTFYISG